MREPAACLGLTAALSGPLRVGALKLYRRTDQRAGASRLDGVLPERSCIRCPSAKARAIWVARIEWAERRISSHRIRLQHSAAARTQ